MKGAGRIKGKRKIQAWSIQTESVLCFFFILSIKSEAQRAKGSSEETKKREEYKQREALKRPKKREEYKNLFY